MGSTCELRFDVRYDSLRMRVYSMECRCVLSMPKLWFMN